MIIATRYRQNLTREKWWAHLTEEGRQLIGADANAWWPEDLTASIMIETPQLRSRRAMCQCNGPFFYVVGYPRDRAVCPFIVEIGD